MFERFTDKARTAVIAARAEAAERGDQIRPVYLLHALASGDGVAARALAGLGVDTDTIERRMDRAAPLRRQPGGEAAGEDAEALASIGIDLDEIRRSRQAVQHQSLRRRTGWRLGRNAKSTFLTALANSLRTVSGRASSSGSS
jgi:hypothetical protein